MSTEEGRRQEEKKLAEMKVAVASRLKRVCGEMNAQQFDELVARISEFKVKWGDSLIYDNPPALGAWMLGKEKPEPPLG